MIQGLVVRCRKAIEPTILFLILFTVNCIFFGMNNSLAAIFLTLSFMRLRNDQFLESNMLKLTGTYLVLGTVAYLATLHLASCIGINFFGTFAVIYLFLDEFNPTNQLPLELAFILYQMIPTPIQGLPYRLLSILVSCVITYVFIRILTVRSKKFQIASCTQRGLETTVGLLRFLAKGDWESVQQEKRQLFEISKEMSRYVYGNDENIFLRRTDGQAYFPFIIVFQHINNIVSVFEKSSGTLCEKDQKYLNQLSLLFQDAVQSIGREINEPLIAQLIAFPHEHELSNPTLDDNMVYVLNYLATALSDLPQYQLHAKKWNYKHRTWIRVKQNFHLQSFKMRFALRLSIVVCPCAAFAYYFQFPHSYWLPMSIFVVMLPFHENSMKKMWERMLGTVIGAIISLIFSHFFPSQTAQLIIMLVANSLTYATTKYTITAIYITCSSLAMNMLIQGADDTLFLYRILYTVAGILVAVLASFLIFPTRNKDELHNLLGNLLEIDQMILQQVHNIALGKQNIRLDRDLILTSYLISGKIQAHRQAASSQESLAYVGNFLEINNQLITDLSHVYTLIAVQPKDRVDLQALEAMLGELQNTLQGTRQQLRKSRKDKPIPQVQIRNIYDNQYVNHKMQHCAERIQALYKVVER